MNPKESWIVVLETLNEQISSADIGTVCPLQTTDIRFKAVAVGKRCLVAVRRDGYPSVWDVIHEIAEKATGRNIDLEIEPLYFDNFPVSEYPEHNTRAAGAGFDYMDQWPPITTGKELPLGWHLDNEHSQLAGARDEVWELVRSGAIDGKIKIAHFDTGVFPEHPAIASNENIRMDLSKNFIDSEKETNPFAVDLEVGGMEQHGHGTGTIGILAGGTVDPGYTDNIDIGYIGAIPFATVIPMRLADSVMIFNTENFTEALEEAIRQGCEVVTMSMGGKPSRRMAKMINRAYEAGITIVTAAGNFITRGFARIGPPTIIYPARFPRVIAACGVCSNHLPYDFEAQVEFGESALSRGLSTEFMQGNWGPPKAMKYALAAFTPNVPWLVKDDELPVKKSGGGTSSATPQIAAAAALWILKNRQALDEKNYTGTWKQVEAVRHALFHSAHKNNFEYWDTYYGNGILQAADALNIPVPEIDDSMKTAGCESTWTGILEALGLFLKRNRAYKALTARQQQILALELEGLLLHHPHLLEQEEVNTRSLEDEEKVVADLTELVRSSANCSEQLRKLILNDAVQR